jgi:hypothetical protein
MNISHLIIDLTAGALVYEVRKFYGEELVKYVLKPVWRMIERKAAIWTHHKLGHESNILDCVKDKCAII